MARLAVIIALFGVSGACGLVYQVVWVRHLVLVFGAGSAAVSTVLAAFMGGLALGGWWLGRRADGLRNPLRVYAWLEAGIGLWALAMPFALTAIDGVAGWVYRATDGGPAYALTRAALAFGVLLVPTTLMGGTLPVLTRLVTPARERFGRVAGMLYAVNTFGAAAGCAAAAFLLLGRLGLSGTTGLAAAANLAVATVAWWWSRGRAADEPGSIEPPPGVAAAPVTDPRATRAVRVVLWGYAISGFAALGYEVLWTRVLAIALGLTTAQSLSVIVVTFLIGIALGGALGARFADRPGDRLMRFAIAQWALGVCGLVSIPLLANVPLVVERLGGLAGFGGHVVRLLVAGVAVMGVPTAIMGLLLPLAGRVAVDSGRGVGRGLGDVYAVNTLGAVAGAIVTGFVLLPWFGTHGALVVLAGANFAVAAVAVIAAGGLPAVRGIRLAVLALPVVVIAATLPARPLELVAARARPLSRLLWLDERASGTVTVYEGPFGGRLLQVNGAGEVPTDDDSIRVFRLLGTLPLVLHAQPRDVLVIAYGGGVTLSAVAAQRPARIDCAELASGVVEASRYFERWNGGLHDRLDEAGIQMVFDDGRVHVARTASTYDVIVSDSTHPATADSWVLYTREFYQRARERLNEDGILAQWLPLHGLTADEYTTIVRTFAAVFPEASVWYTPGYSVLLGTTAPLRVDLELVRRRIAAPGVAADLAEVGLADPVEFVAVLALDADAVRRFVGDGPLTTDDRVRVGFGDRGRVGVAGVPAAEALVPHLIATADPWLAAPTPVDRQVVERRLRARALALEADAALRRGDRDEALRRLARAVAADPDCALALRLRERALGRRR